MTMWVMNDQITVPAPCPLLLQERPNSCPALSDATGQKRMFALARKRTDWASQKHHSCAANQNGPLEPYSPTDHSGLPCMPAMPEHPSQNFRQEK